MGYQTDRLCYQHSDHWQVGVRGVEGEQPSHIQRLNLAHLLHVFPGENITSSVEVKHKLKKYTTQLLGSFFVF